MRGISFIFVQNTISGSSPFAHLLYDILSLVQGSLCRSQSRDRHAERGAGNVVKAKLVAEHYGRRISAVLAADTHMKLRTNALA